jgi:hypothetical protein
MPRYAPAASGIRCAPPFLATGQNGNSRLVPLPPDGPVTFVASWLQHEVAETRADLSSSVIHETVQRAVILWPDEP